MRRVILISLLFMSLWMTQSCSKKELPEKPNILLIMVDYQAGEDIPDETPVLKMPNLQILSEDGIIFRNHICTAPVCMPARYSIISGRYPHYTKMWDNCSKWLPDGTPLLMGALSDQGYHTAGIGKMHFYPWDRMAEFDERIIADRKGNWAGDTLYHDDYYQYLKKAGYTRNDYLKLQDSGEIFGLYDWPLDDSLHIDYFVGDQAAKYLGNIQKDKPWFVWVSFNGPHNPWDAPKKYSEYYLNKELPSARRKEGELEEQPIDITRTRYNYTRKLVDKFDMNPEKQDEIIHRIRAGHYGNLTFIDEQVGKILESLDETDQLDNTIVIWTADHGCSLGDHGLIHKGTHYERSSSVPFVVWFGKNIKKGERLGFSSHVDLMPTLIDLAGGEGHNQLEGHSLKKMITGDSEGDDHAFVEILGNYSIITHNYLYGVFPMSKERVLIDRISDPEEFENLIDNPNYKSISDSLEKILYNFHPEIKDEYERMKDMADLPEKVSFFQGREYGGTDVPYLGGKPFTITADFSFSPGYEGPIFAFHEGQTHGLSLYVKNNSLFFGVRTFSVDQIELLSDKIEGGRNFLTISLNTEGMIEVSMSGKVVKRLRSSWPMPIQPGNTHFLSGTWMVGKPAPRWMGSIGSYERNSVYPGKINEICIDTNGK